MAIENVAGETAGTPVAADVGPGAMQGDDNFTLPSDFDANIDDGIEVPADAGGTTEGADTLRPLPASGVTAPTAQPAAQPGAQPTQQVAVQPVQPVAPQAPQVAQPASQPVTQGVDGGAGRRIFTPGELAQQLGANRETMIEALASQKFQLTPAETQALEVDAVGVLPKIMARVYFEATVNGLQQMANMVPRMVEHVANERFQENAAETDFHTEWPNIDRNNQGHMRAVAQLAASFRQMNPSASQADAVKFVGMAATNFLGLQMPVKPNGGAARPGNGAPPARRSAQPSFVPASGGRAQPPAGTPTAPQNPFEGLGMQFDE